MSKQFYIGGHDAAAILGVAKYKTPLQLWGLKLGKLAHEDISEKDVIKRGHALEPHLLKLYGGITKRHVLPMSNEAAIDAVLGATPACTVIKRQDRSGQVAIVSPEYEWAVAALDGVAFDLDQDKPIAVDGKTTSVWIRDEWGERPEREYVVDPSSMTRVPVPTATEIPIEAQVQLQHYMWVTKLDKASFAVGIVDDKAYREPVEHDGVVMLPGVTEFLWCDMERNDSFIHAMAKKLVEFAECLRTERRPHFEARAEDREIMAELLGAELPAKEMDLRDEEMMFVEGIHNCMDAIETCKEQKAKYEVALMNRMGDAAIGHLPNGKKVHFKMRKGFHVEKQEYDVEPKRVLTVPRRQKKKS